MRTNQLAVAAVLAATALSVNAAQTRMESATSPFTYEVLGATPSLTFGRAPAAAPKAAEAPKPAAVKPASANANRAAGAATTTFTYDALGATPRVEVRKPARAEAVTPPSAQ